MEGQDDVATIGVRFDVDAPFHGGRPTRINQIKKSAGRVEVSPLPHWATRGPMGETTTHPIDVLGGLGAGIWMIIAIPEWGSHRAVENSLKGR